MRKVVFIDRDGVINNDTGHYYIYKPEDFIFNLGLLESLTILQKRGFEFVVVSNQGGISKRTYSKIEVEKVHAKMVEGFKEKGIELLEVYYCPHHSEVEKCWCRKPGALMIEKAIARFGIDKEASFLIGDNTKDIEAASSAGIRGVKIESNQNLLTIIESLV